MKSWLARSDQLDSGIGIAILLEHTSYEIRQGHRVKSFGFGTLFRYLRPYRSYLVQLGIAILTGSIISLIFPFITQSIVDTGIGSGNIHIVLMFLIAQVMLVLGQMANNLIRSWLMLHMSTRVSISLISGFLGKLMRLPISFFDSKRVGDIIQRIGRLQPYQTFLTGAVLSITMAAVSLIVYSVIMAGYSLYILGVFVLGSLLYITWILLFMKRRQTGLYALSGSCQSKYPDQLIGGMQKSN